MVEIDFDERALAAMQDGMKRIPQKTAVATMHTINRTMTKASTMISKETRVRYVVKAANVKKSLSKKKATRSRLVGEIVSTGKPLPLQSFKVTKPRRGPMKAKVLKKGKLKTIRGLYVNEKTRYKGVLMRKTSERYPVKSPFGPSIPTMIGNEEVLGRLAPQISAFMNQRFLHELDYQMGKFGGKS